MKLVTGLLIYCAGFFGWPQVIEAQVAGVSHDRYHQFEGDFYFPDGSYITGGPNDEVKGSLLFIDPVSLKRGGLFVPIDSTEFKSLPDSSWRIRFITNATGAVTGLWWYQKESMPVKAIRKNQPHIERVRIPANGFELAGELYMPANAKNVPLIIQVHGSGRQGRHAGPWNTFALQHGFATLCYDKRGVGASGGNYATAGYLDLADDLLAVIAFAQKQPGIDINRIGIHASSEGGWVATIAAARHPRLAFMIVRAGSGLSGSDTYMYEMQQELKDKKLTQQQYHQAVKFERRIQDMAAEKIALDSVNNFISKYRQQHEWFPKAFGDYREMQPSYYIKLQQSGRIDPATYLRTLDSLPILWFLAGKDENVPYEISRIRLTDATNESGNPNFELITLPGARHSFLVFDDKGVHYAPGYWSKMQHWLKTFQ